MSRKELGSWEIGTLCPENWPATVEAARPLWKLPIGLGPITAMLEG